MKKKERVSELRLEGLLKNAFNMQLQPLKSLKTATKKRRALKRATNNSGLSKSSPSPSGS